jgi:hypothetical protein
MKLTTCVREGTQNRQINRSKSKNRVEPKTPQFVDLFFFSLMSEIATALTKCKNLISEVAKKFKRGADVCISFAFRPSSPTFVLDDSTLYVSLDWLL